MKVWKMEDLKLTVGKIAKEPVTAFLLSGLQAENLYRLDIEQAMKSEPGSVRKFANMVDYLNFCEKLNSPCSSMPIIVRN